MVHRRNQSLDEKPESSLIFKLSSPVVAGMATQWTITVKVISGKATKVQASNGPNTTILDLKKQVEEHQEKHLPPHRQRLIFPGGNNAKLEDLQKTLAHYGVTDGSALMLIVLERFVLYVIALDGSMHEIEVPSSDPENFPIDNLFPILQEQLKQQMLQCQVLYNNKPLEKVRHGKKMTLKDHDIKSSTTLVVTKPGITLSITDPKVDLCFLVDCTGSMGSHIDAVKNCVKKVRDDLVQQFQGCDIRFAFVRYTDYDQPEYSRTTHIDFTQDQYAFYNFVNTIRADGGGDSAEDIMGGLQAAFSRLSWGDEEVVKVMVHVADCPCHGSQYHNNVNDNHQGGDPAGISHEDMMKKVVERNIQYWFGYINSSMTDKMIQVFNESLQRQSQRRLLICQVEAKEPKQMGDAVNKSIMGSVFGAAAARQAAVKTYTINQVIPEWGPILELHGKKTSSPPLRSMADLQKGIKIDPPAISISFKCAPDPFAEGEECIVYHGYDVSGKRKVVFKKYKREGDEYNKLECYTKELEVRTITNTYVQAFNDEKGKPPSSLLMVHPVEIVQCEGSQQIYMLETFLKGNVEKYNNNAGIVCTRAAESDMMQAFSHYSWVKSGRSMLICDLQGVQSYSTIILTDPAIHSTIPGLYGFTDHGEAGIKKFFKTHQCGNFCIQMGLNSQLP